MNMWLADGFFSGAGQSSRQTVELLAAFGLTALIGLERTVQGKSAGLRTQTIVGTSAALIMLVSKYGFFDVLQADVVAVDPSRVAAQIVSGIGFLGAGIIITRRGAVHGLTTAAAIWVPFAAPLLFRTMFFAYVAPAARPPSGLKELPAGGE